MTGIGNGPQLRRSRSVALESTGPMTQYRTDRRCKTSACVTVLSRYNPSEHCAAHKGWEDPLGKRSLG